MSILSILIAFIIAKQAFGNGCFQENLFSTKTPYAFIQNKDVSIKKPAENCIPVHINMIHRHGHRYPSIKDMKNMMEVGNIINKVPNSVAINLKRPWNLPYTFEQEKILTKVGEKELFEIGKRVVARFPEIFDHPYTPFNFTFQSTCKLRCTHSAISLAAGLFDGKGHLGTGNYQPINLETYPCHNDKVLRFFDHCEKYVQHIAESEAGKREMNVFSKSLHVANVIDKIKQKLGGNHVELKPKHLKVLMIMCAYELGMHDGSLSSGICSLLDEEDRLVGEYLIDLKHFYVRSAGFKINYESACPLLTDIVTTMKSFVSNPSEGKIGIFRSAHAETIIPLYALLNVSLDSTQMTAENFKSLESRKFRGACLSPFSGNMYFVLFKCGDSNDDTYKVQLYINERLVEVPWCESSIDCDLNDFFAYVESSVKNCHFDHICNIKKEEL